MNETTPVESQPLRDMGILSRITNVFFSPAETFAAVRIRPAWLIPMIFLVVVGALSSLVVQPIAMKEQTQRAVETMQDRGMSQEQIDQAMEVMKTNPVARVMRHPAVGMIIALVVGPIALVIIAAVWLVVGKMMIGGQIVFPQTLGLVVYQSFIGLLGTCIKLPLVVVKQTVDIHFSIAAFLDMDPKGFGGHFVYSLLSKIEIFSIWGIAVLAIGLAVLTQKPLNKVLPWVIAVYVIYYLGAAAMTGLSAMLGGM
ncbi:YIP1 family protein [candidate division KSB1 bacterium]|nr:YIP1 family protein [candidate division KSB1 bacterium]